MNRRGFTLLEFVIASLLVMVVLTGLYNVLSSMVNFQIEGVRKSSVNTWSMVAQSVMTKEIEGASVIYFPTKTITPTNAVLGCTNWSTVADGPNTGGPLDANAADPTTLFYYCWDKSSSDKVYYLRRLAAQGSGLSRPSCPTLASGIPSNYARACTKTGNLGFGAGVTQTNEVLAADVNSLAAGGSLFSYDSNANALNLNFIIGNNYVKAGSGQSAGTSNARIIESQTATVSMSIPTFEHSYPNSND